MAKRLSLLWTLVRGDLKKLWWALRDPRAPGWLKYATAGLVLYLVSPFDLLPDAIPFFGVIDDVVLLPLAVRWLLGRLPQGLQTELDARAAAG
ncbi:YkvA family protein [Pseudorhodoferax sp.]|uniref:YkvA family protein n=1 Tax=Pseudorhodoferax sp. TaxID=1993553 RepID=UPI0039E6B59A